MCSQYTVVYCGILICTVCEVSMQWYTGCAVSILQWYTELNVYMTIYRLPNGYIRFDKCMSLARLVTQILDYKDIVVRAMGTMHEL